MDYGGGKGWEQGDRPEDHRRETGERCGGQIWEMMLRRGSCDWIRSDRSGTRWQVGPSSKRGSKLECSLERMVSEGPFNARVVLFYGTLWGSKSVPPI